MFGLTTISKFFLSKSDKIFVTHNRLFYFIELYVSVTVDFMYEKVISHLIY